MKTWAPLLWWAAALALLCFFLWPKPARAAQSALTIEKQAFARITPCPNNGYKTIYCKATATKPEWFIVYPTCAPTREFMRWATTPQKPVWAAQMKIFCQCRDVPFTVLGTTSRGKTGVAVYCTLPKALT